MKPHIYFIVPVYNEAKNVSRLFDTFRLFSGECDNSYSIQIILVDDGSRDGTAELARGLAGNMDLVVLQQDHNLGPGKAFAKAFGYLASQFGDSDIVVTMEGDNTSRLELVNQMLHRLEEHFDAIFASPYLYGGGIENTSTWRVFLSSMANLFVKEMLGIHGIMTVSSFFRLYRVEFLKKMQYVYGPEIIERHGFECMIEMTMKMVSLKARISEISMVLDTSARVGKSRMKVFSTIIGYFSLWFSKRKWMTHPATHLNQLPVSE